MRAVRWAPVVDMVAEDGDVRRKWRWTVAERSSPSILSEWIQRLYLACSSCRAKLIRDIVCEGF